MIDGAPVNVLDFGARPMDAESFALALEAISANSGTVIDTILQNVAASGGTTISYELPVVLTAGQTVYVDTAIVSGDVAITGGSYSFVFIDEGLKSDPL